MNMYTLILALYRYLIFSMIFSMILSCADTENIVSTNTQLNLMGDQTVIRFNVLDQDPNANLFDRYVPISTTQDAQVEMPRNDAQVQTDSRVSLLIP